MIGRRSGKHGCVLIGGLEDSDAGGRGQELEYRPTDTQAGGAGWWLGQAYTLKKLGLSFSLRTVLREGDTCEEHQAAGDCVRPWSVTAIMTLPVGRVPN